LRDAKLVDEDKKIGKIDSRMPIQIDRQIPGQIPKSRIKSVYKSKKVLKFYLFIAIEIS